MLDNSKEILGKLLTWASAEKRLDIQFDFADDDQWASFTMYEYDPDKEISLRLHLNNVYEIHLGYYDRNDDFQEETHILTNDEKEIVPSALNKIMTKVLGDEEGLSVAGKIIKA